MPKGYESLRNRFVREGLKLKAAKTKAAKIYNAAHPSRPVTQSHTSASNPLQRGARDNRDNRDSLTSMHPLRSLKSKLKGRLFGRSTIPRIR